MPSILLVVSKFPYPPRSGETIPIVNFVESLPDNYTVDLLLLDKNSESVDFDAESTNNVVFRNIYIKKITRKNFLLGVFWEIILRRPSFSNYTIAGNSIYDIVDENVLKAYSFIVASPIMPADLCSFDTQFLEHSAKKIAILSDCYTTVLRHTNNGLFFAMGDFKLIGNAFRSLLMHHLESRIVQRFHYIIGQTNQDKMWFEKLLPKKLECPPDIRVISNHVEEDLFEIPILTNRNECLRVILVANWHAGFYQRNLRVFMKDVWGHMDVNKFELQVIGKGLKDDLREQVERYSNASVNEKFVENLRDIYTSVDVVVAPIFKRYGLINKSIQGMASGCVVIGDSTAFNGIRGFESGVHGLIFNKYADIVYMLDEIYKDATNAKGMRVEARKLIKNQFIPEITKNKYLEILSE